jgi:hypothetical protein
VAGGRIQAADRPEPSNPQGAVARHEVYRTRRHMDTGGKNRADSSG